MTKQPNALPNGDLIAGLRRQLAETQAELAEAVALMRWSVPYLEDTRILRLARSKLLDDDWSRVYGEETTRVKQRIKLIRDFLKSREQTADS